MSSSSPPPAFPGRRRMLRASRAGGAVASQASQAVASLSLQLLVSRTLGPAGLSQYAVLYGSAVLATAVITGMVGDSLTVVDRSRPAVRAGLQWWTVVTSSGLGVVVALVGCGTTSLTPASGVVLGLAVTAFLVEDTVRRLLMATSRFWSVVLVDLGALTGAVVTALAVNAYGRPSLHGYLVALLVGQVVAVGVGLPLLPAAERWLAPWRGADRRVVAGFGTWRAAQQTLRPGMLTAARLLVVAALGSAAYGRVEGARLLVTPVTLIVSGTGNLLLVSYARDRGQVLSSRALRRADSAAGALLGTAAVLGLAATALAPAVGHLVTAGAYRLDVVAVGGWVLYGATSAVVLPYATLAAVHRRQGPVFALRVLDCVVSVGLVALVLADGAGASAMPYALSSGSLVSAVLVRRLVLVPLLGAPAPAPRAADRPVDAGPGPASTSSPQR